ncbi:MAG: hypothetical protein HC936_18305 [Leptolyngbyaceae cyanobacterium SU_3_3]|nr:hypothetical protein [Leptolyngbyaceae cyanobacterium SU_3_3]
MTQNDSLLLLEYLPALKAEGYGSAIQGQFIQQVEEIVSDRFKIELLFLILV